MIGEENSGTIGTTEKFSGLSNNVKRGVIQENSNENDEYSNTEIGNGPTRLRRTAQRTSNNQK